MSSELDYKMWYKKHIDRMKKVSKEAVQETLRESWMDFFIQAEDRIRVMFKGVVQDFYASYTPIEYDRNYSLYDILKTTSDTEYLEIGFSPIDMTPFRSGYFGEDGLYDQVFRKGWHGGATSGVGHPNPGQPYWRKPYPYYPKWGRPATIAPIAPLDDIRKRIADYVRNGQQADFERAWKSNIKHMKLKF